MNTNTSTLTTLPWENDPEGCYLIGRMGKPHGVKGEICFTFSDDVFDRLDADYIILEIDGLPVPFFFEEYRFRSDDLALVKLEGIDTEDDARRLTGCGVYFPRSLSEADTDKASWAELHGFTVVEAGSGRKVGTVVDVDDSTQNILLQVTTPEGSELLLPVNEELLEKIDKRARQLVLVIPEGLLDL
ncbi:MAG: ribosome maturation factor RimM [Prevotella sp.]|jgi:16S rRNA processing protein RimM